jgi:tRNA uridine 5-carbamoylmethylation protein Kti12
LENFLICLTGLPASGKTTLAYKIKNYFESRLNRFNITIIDPDIIRKEITAEEFDYKKEQTVREINLESVKKALKEGQIVISDDLNYYTSMRHDLKEIAESLNVNFYIIHVSTPLDICIKWNEKRGKPIPNKIIKNIHKKFDDFSKYSWDIPFDKLDFSKLEDLDQHIDDLINKINKTIRIKEETRKTGGAKQFQPSFDNEKLDKITRNIAGGLMKDPKYLPFRNQIIKFRKKYVKSKVNTTINEMEISKSFKEYLEKHLNTKIS